MFALDVAHVLGGFQLRLKAQTLMEKILVYFVTEKCVMVEGFDRERLGERRDPRLSGLRG
jgi:hypothetical protein